MSGYLFDKRKRKRTFIKYLIIFTISFVPVVLFNVYIAKNLSDWLVIFLDAIIILFFVLIGNIIANRIFDKKDRRLQAKINEREKLQKAKEEILRQSYKAKRDKKIKEKEENAKEENADGGKTNQKKDK